MKKLIAPLSLLLMSTSVYADEASEALKKHILEGQTWKGSYGVEYYEAAVNAKGVPEFFYKSTEDAAYEEQDLDIKLSFAAAELGLGYEWDREIRSSGETDDKTCATQVDKKTKKVIGKTLPRVLILKQDLLDTVDKKAPASKVPDLNKAEKEKIEAQFAGIQKKLSLRDPVIALIKGKRCNAGVIGDDLNVPVLKIEASKDGKSLDIIASLGVAEGFETVMGYSLYKLKKAK